MKRLIGLFCFYVLLTNAGLAQIGNQSQDDPFKSLLQQQGGQIPSAGINADAPELFGSVSEGNVHTKTMPLEGELNPDEYIIGPNDLFSLGLYGYINQQVPLYVLPEGAVVIPTVGEVHVSGLTLREAKAKVVSAVKERYYSSDVSFTLTMPRTFIIKVSGLIQSSYEVSPVTRPSEILKRLFFDSTNVSRTIYEKDNEREQLMSQLSLRNIELKRKDGTTQNVDIYKYFITGEDKYNPYFREGDVLKIPSLLLQRNYITVAGAVQLPGTYEHSKGDDLKTLVGLGREFDLNAEPDSIILFRPNENSKGYQTINLEYEKDKDYPIKVYDRIFVKYKTDYQKKATVLVLGEVQRPGYYPVAFKETRLKEAVEMAGGLTKDAYLPLSILFRDYDQEYTDTDTMEIWVNQRANDVIISEKDQQNFWNDVQSRRNRVIVDYEKLLNNNDQSQNVILEDKDIIYINDNKNIVYVYGQVNNEGYVPYKEGKDYEYYIEKAGGYSLAALEGDTRIIKFNSRGWYKPDDTQVESGDFVYVPKEVKSEFKDVISIIAQVAGVILGVVTTFILINNN